MQQLKGLLRRLPALDDARIEIDNPVLLDAIVELEVALVHAVGGSEPGDSTSIASNSDFTSGH